MTRLATLVAVLVAAVVATCLPQQAAAMVLGIDFGASFIKVALVKPGRPFEIVTNIHSKRKTEGAVTMYNGERLFGGDTKNMATRKPKLTFQYTKALLGRSADHPSVKAMTAATEGIGLPYELVADEERGTVKVVVPEAAGTELAGEYAAEELVAYVLSHIRYISGKFAEYERVRDAVITVPSFWTQFERQSLIDAAETAGLRVLSLIEDNTAAALQFGLDRTFANGTERVLFFNMGATSTQASLVEYGAFYKKLSKFSAKNKTVGEFSVIGKAWDETTGTLAFDRVITEYLADHWNKVHMEPKGKGDVRANTRAMAKLRFKSSKVKEVLSANKAIPISMGSFMDDEDLKAHITRDQFEELADGLFHRAVKVATRAVEAAGLTPEEVDQIEIIGGGVRMPKVQRLLKEYFKPMVGSERMKMKEEHRAAAAAAAASSTDKKGKGKGPKKEEKKGNKGEVVLGVHLDGNEAMALGAAFRAANISTLFKVREVGLSDRYVYPVGVKLRSLAAPGSGPAAAKSEAVEGGKDDEKPWSKRAALFKKYNRAGSKKTVTFKHDQDIIATFKHDAQSELPEGHRGDRGTVIRTFNLTGIRSFAAKHNRPAKEGDLGAEGKEKQEERSLGKPKVSITFKLTDSGIATIQKAEASLEETVEVEIDDYVDEEVEEEEEVEEVIPEGEEGHGMVEMTAEEIEKEDKEIAAKEKKEKKKSKKEKKKKKKGKKGKKKGKKEKEEEDEEKKEEAPAEAAAPEEGDKKKKKKKKKAAK